MHEESSLGRGQVVEGFLALASGELHFIREGRASFAVFPTIDADTRTELYSLMHETQAVWISGKSEGGVEGGIVFEKIDRIDPEKVDRMSLDDEVCLDHLRERTDQKGNGLKAFGIEALIKEQDRIAEILEKEGFPPLAPLSRNPDDYVAYDFGTQVRVKPVVQPLSAVEEGTRIQVKVGVSFDSQTSVSEIAVDSIAFAEKDGARYRDRIGSIEITPDAIEVHSRRAKEVFAVIRDDSEYYAVSPGIGPIETIPVSRIVGGNEGFDLESMDVKPGDKARFMSLPVTGLIGAGDVTVGSSVEDNSAFKREPASPAADRDYAGAVEAFKRDGYGEPKIDLVRSRGPGVSRAEFEFAERRKEDANLIAALQMQKAAVSR